VLGRHRPPNPCGLDQLGRGQASWFWWGQAGVVKPAISWSVFFLFLFLFFFCNQIVIMFKGTKDSCSASYGDKKPISKRLPARFTSS